ncbi:SWI/SNF-related matrix-associated actin-dependent regulator of chromatin subfamily A containing DEAD/H box 1 homolog [Hyposmocoma kahamanoa]|uniref:SWI/SNF-related matrix-associated actin-dependent regulator of chromatin subfamily A containing DEAD/H box 1 homolog n=1 Tax=Hyposmocoma kahamanoa TaxID=1477025 RepID=UPI000E6D8371|nr:SWI/SNF-related matrix-associated actin-dependent regulator of chromatin subfamily A containing DEAD/H box 1 homolog [Hyposmocoma kahamanoa]
MSDGNSPSTLSYLRQYRFQRKPNIAGSSGSVTVQASPSSSQIIRMPAPYQNSSHQTVNRGPIVYKRIRLQDSDSDDNPTPVKKQIPNATPSLIGQKVVELTTAVKERRFRNMLEMFPEISPVFVKNTLLKHVWNEERARDELLKHDPENEERGSSSSSFFGSRPGFSGHPHRPNGMGVVRVSSGAMTNIIVRKPLTAQGGRVRRGSSGSEDDDYGVKKGKDDKVYDSDDSDNEITDDLGGDKRKVFEFLNKSNLNELSMLSGCSQKKAEAILAQRPFKGWLDMVSSF